MLLREEKTRPFYDAVEALTAAFEANINLIVTEPRCGIVRAEKRAMVVDNAFGKLYNAIRDVELSFCREE